MSRRPLLPVFTAAPTAALAAAVALAAGCGAGLVSPLDKDDAAPAPTTALTPIAVHQAPAPALIGPHAAVGPTWVDDVQPIIAERCQQCHVLGGAGPFPLVAYDDVAPMADYIAEITEQRIMPPFAVDNSGTCHKYKDARWLEDDELAVLREWAEAGAPEGEGTPTAAPAVLPGIDDPDAVADSGGFYTPDINIPDDLRCFVSDSGVTGADKFLTAFEVVPSDPTVVHHMILFQVPPGAAQDAVVARDQAAPGLGYPCGDGEGVGQGTTPVAGWAPGIRTIELPDGVGTRVKAGAKLIMQVHYHLHDNLGHPDHTQVKLKLADDVQEETALGGMAPVSGTSFPIPAGAADGVVSGNLPLSLLRGTGASSIRLYGVFPHMHTRGRSMSITWEHDTGAGGTVSDCIADVPRYDFNWQQSFFYDEPIEIPLEGRVHIDCHYDTTADERPVSFGEGTDSEMCFGFFTAVIPGAHNQLNGGDAAIAPPPGTSFVADENGSTIDHLGGDPSLAGLLNLLGGLGALANAGNAQAQAQAQPRSTIILDDIDAGASLPMSPYVSIGQAQPAADGTSLALTAIPFTLPEPVAIDAAGAFAVSIDAQLANQGLLPPNLPASQVSATGQVIGLATSTPTMRVTLTACLARSAVDPQLATVPQFLLNLLVPDCDVDGDGVVDGYQIVTTTSYSAAALVP